LTAGVRAYRCGEHRVGLEVRRDRGLRVGATIVDAVGLWANREGSEYGTSWPLRLFEGSVANTDVLATEPQEMRVRAWCCEREVPLSEVFGPRTPEVLEFVEGVEHLRWLRPAPDASIEARLAALVAEHYACLSDYGQVAPLPMRVVRTWHEARDLREDIEERSEAANVAIRQSGAVFAGTTTGIAIQLVQHRVVRLALFKAWQAAWQEAGRSAATGVHAASLFQNMPGWDEHFRLASATQAVNTVIQALDAAREPAWAASWNVAYHLFNQGTDGVPSLEHAFAGAVVAAQRAVSRAQPDRPIHSAGCATCAEAPLQRDAMVADFIFRTSVVALSFAVEAAQIASWHATHLVNPSSGADPWRPLVDIWRLGGLPLGPAAHSFLVLLPEPRN
jgi:hypothetical protein